jgi:hypothetical protein
MKRHLTARTSTLVLVFCFGLALVTSTTPTIAYNTSSRINPTSQPNVGVLFSNGFTYYYHHHAHVVGSNKSRPRDPADVFDHK